MDDPVTIKNGKLNFKWKEGKQVTLSCLVKNESEIEHDEITMTGMGELESVEVIYDDKQYPLCLECHTHLVKTRITEKPEYSGHFAEVSECLNPDCPNKL